jgi:hypothetical protein
MDCLLDFPQADRSAVAVRNTLSERFGWHLSFR